MGFRSNVPPFAMLRAFDAYGQTGRMRRAAAELGVSHAIVSRHLRGLEERLGVMLIDRRKGGLTLVGQDYHARIGLAFDQIGAASDRISGIASARLSAWCIPGLAYHWLTARLPTFSALHPSTALDLRPTDAPPDLMRRQADADIRWILDSDEQSLPKGLRGIDLARPRIFPVARPDALWMHDVAVNQPSDLLKLPLLQEDSDREWREWLTAHKLGSTVIAPSARLWQAHMTLAAAADGQGVALTNYFLAAEHLESGRLIEIGRDLPDFQPVTIGAYRFVGRDENWEIGPCAWFRRWIMDAIEDAHPGSGRPIS